jgi:hypothetical protein
MSLFDENVLDYFTFIFDLTEYRTWTTFGHKINNVEIFVKLLETFNKIDHRKWVFCKFRYENLKETEKKQYEFEESLFRKKYSILAKIETVFNLTLIIKKNIHSYYPLKFLENNTSNIMKKCIKIFEDRVKYFLIEISKLDFYMKENEKCRLKFIKTTLNSFLDEIKERKRQQKLLFHLPFYKGSAEIINIYGIKQEIMDYIY